MKTVVSEWLKESRPTVDPVAGVAVVGIMEVLTLNDPIRAIFLYSRNGTNEFEARTEHLLWYNVEWSAMDKTTHSRSEECVIDDYTFVEDSQNAPILVEVGKECVNHWTYGKSIYSSLELLQQCTPLASNRANQSVLVLQLVLSFASANLCRSRMSLARL